MAVYSSNNYMLCYSGYQMINMIIVCLHQLYDKEFFPGLLLVHQPFPSLTHPYVVCQTVRFSGVNADGVTRSVATDGYFMGQNRPTLNKLVCLR